MMSVWGGKVVCTCFHVGVLVCVLLYFCEMPQYGDLFNDPCAAHVTISPDGELSETLLILTIALCCYVCDSGLHF